MMIRIAKNITMNLTKYRNLEILATKSKGQRTCEEFEKSTSKQVLTRLHVFFTRFCS